MGQIVADHGVGPVLGSSREIKKAGPGSNLSLRAPIKEKQAEVHSGRLAINVD